MLSDLIEGVPPSFVLNWAEGYFFWAAFVWMAYQLIGRESRIFAGADLAPLRPLRRLDHVV